MYPLFLQVLPYQRDSKLLMSLLSPFAGCICLESGLTDQLEARYDILTALPSVQQRVMAEPSKQAQAFKLAQTLIDHYRPDHAGIKELEALRHLPFSGGLMGFFGYEAASISPHALPHNASSVPVADASQLAQIPIAVFGLYDWAIIVDHQQARSELFILPQCPPDIRQQVLDVSAEYISLTVSASFGTGSFTQDSCTGLLESFKPMIDKAQYAQSFDRLKNWILAGDCYQANLAIPFAAPFQGSAFSIYSILRQQSQSPFSAFIDAGDFQILSVSPERFLSVIDGRVFTQPIKGTRKRLADPDEDSAVQQVLLSSEKDKAENLMIVDLLRNDLGRVCVTGSVKTESLFKLHSFTHVHHLISTISAQLPADSSPLALLESCFPGGSITGAPKIRAMQIIAELEQAPRTVYCGSIFYCDYFDRMDSSILIRTLLSTGQQLFCWGGSGVVADSVMAEEYQECLDKVSALMNLPIADQCA